MTDWWTGFVCDVLCFIAYNFIKFRVGLKSSKNTNISFIYCRVLDPNFPDYNYNVETMINQ